MNYGIISEGKLPKSLAKEEQLLLFHKMANGDMEAREKLIMHNLRLVSTILQKKFGSTKTDEDELFSIGVIGLIESIDRFDISKNIEFSTYAFPMIYGKIMTFLRVQHRVPKFMSIETAGSANNDNEDLSIVNILSDSSDLVADYEQKDIYRIINIIIENLPPRNKEITKLYFGFYGNKPKSQTEIANIFGITPQAVSMILKKVLNQIKIELYKQGILEYYDLTIKERYEEKEKDKHPRKPKTIYTLFKYYSKDQIDDMLSRLNKEERKLVTLRYGDDLDHPVASERWNDKKKKN